MVPQSKRRPKDTERRKEREKERDVGEYEQIDHGRGMTKLQRRKGAEEGHHDKKEGPVQRPRGAKLMGRGWKRNGDKRDRGRSTERKNEIRKKEKSVQESIYDGKKKNGRVEIPRRWAATLIISNGSRELRT